jgi:hypothetical protein
LRAAWKRFSDYLELNDWQRRVRREEAYLAQSASLEDLERRMRDLDREERRPRFMGILIRKHHCHPETARQRSCRDNALEGLHS